MKYVTNCTECNKEIPVKNHECYFYEARPFCYSCRNKFIDLWVKRSQEEELKRFDASIRRKLKDINRHK